MSISREDVEHIALLSRLYLSEDEIERYREEMARILAYVEKIASLDTEDVPPTSHAIPLANVYREDTIATSLGNDVALTNAPDKEPPYFRVPRIVD